MNYWFRTIAPILGGILLALPVGSHAVQSRRTPVVDAVEKALPTVVNIGTEGYVQVQYQDTRRQLRGSLYDRLFQDFFGPPPPPDFKRVTSLGSGVVIHPAGYILTNYHVIERATQIRVTTMSGTTYQARVLAGDELNDLALLKIEPMEELHAVQFEKDDDLLLGETVIALGNPLGLSQTVTEGVLSAKNREARYKGEVLFRDILQTDAAVSYGSSGGPLMNINGNMIGVSVAISPEGQNIGFAVPVSRVRALMERWLAPRIASKIWPQFDVEMREGRLVVKDLAEDGEPAELGLNNGDQILSVSGTPVAGVYDYHYQLLSFREGDGVEIEFNSAGGTRKEIFPLVAVPKSSGLLLAQKFFGIELATPEATSEALGLRIGKGLLVLKVEADSPAQVAGLVPGLLVARINRREISTLDDVGEALTEILSGDSVEIQLLALRMSNGMLVSQQSGVEVRAR